MDKRKDKGSGKFEKSAFDKKANEQAVKMIRNGSIKIASDDIKFKKK